MSGPRCGVARAVHGVAWILPLLAAFLTAAPSAAATVELTPAQQRQIFDEAIAAFDRGASVQQAGSADARAAFRTAAEKFQLLVDAGLRNGLLYYNLGNAWLEAGELGRAILNFRRAQEYLQGDGRLEHNLRYARSLCRTPIESTGSRALLRTLFFWHETTTLRTRALLGLSAYVAFWLLLAAATVVPRRSWRLALIPLLAVWIVLGASVAVDLRGGGPRAGVLIADDVVVRKGNGERFAPVFTQALHEGVEFHVLERHGDWLHIELPDGRTGWIQAGQAGLV